MARRVGFQYSIPPMPPPGMGKPSEAVADTAVAAFFEHHISGAAIATFSSDSAFTCPNDCPTSNASCSKNCAAASEQDGARPSRGALLVGADDRGFVVSSQSEQVGSRSDVGARKGISI